MKKTKIIFAVLLSVLMLTAAMLPASAEGIKDPEGDDRGENLAEFVYLYSVSKSGDYYFILSDGDRGSNNSGDVNKGYSSAEKSSDNQCEYSHRGTSTASVTMTPADDTRITYGDRPYFYVFDINLKGKCKVTGFTCYLQGYKAAVMDHSVDILYSTDNGETWKVMAEAHTPFDDAAVYHYENYDKNNSFDGSQYGAGKDTDTTIETPAYLYVDLTLTPIENVTNVAWACVTPRCNNAHYTSRITEFEVYGEVTEAPTEAPTDAPTEAPTAAPTSAEDQPTEAPTSAGDQPADPAGTKAPEESKKTDDKKGCSSSVFSGMLLCLVPAAVVFRKKRK